MKAAFSLALFGALFVVSYASCPYVAYHACIKEEKPTKCKAVEVCEEKEKELCGDDSCEYPYKCAYAAKEECKKFAVLKEKCEAKKVCKKVKKACGDGYCYLDQDCVKETKCYVKKSGGRKLLGKARANSYAHASGDDSTAHAHSYAKTDGDGDADAKSVAIAKDEDEEDKYGYYPYKKKEDEDEDDDKKEEDEDEDEDDDKDEDEDKTYGYYYPYRKKELVCEDEYTCVAKEECKDVTVKKCVKKELREGIDYCEGGHDFYWYPINDEEKCGEEYCGYGYECAEVIIQKCETECGDNVCEYGYDCVVEDEECEQFALLETVCKDVYKPTCVPLPPYILLTYKPPCKTVYECEEEENVCGEEYCAKGYVCAIDYKKKCGYGYYPAHDLPVVSKPEKSDDEYKHTYYIQPYEYKEEEKDEEEKKDPEEKKEDEEKKDPEEKKEDEEKKDPEEKSGSAYASADAQADEDGVTTDVQSYTTGDATADSYGSSETGDASSHGDAHASEGKAEVYGATEAEDGKEANFYGDAGADVEHEP